MTTDNFVATPEDRQLFHDTKITILPSKLEADTFRITQRISVDVILSVEQVQDLKAQGRTQEEEADMFGRVMRDEMLTAIRRDSFKTF